MRDTSLRERLKARIVRAALVVATCALTACAAPVEEAPPALPPPAIAVPIEMTVWQRTTTVVPGSGDALELTVDDITAGQVMASLARHGEVVRSQVSLTEGASAKFTLDGRAYELRLKAMVNSLLGDDSATFEIKAANGEPVDTALSETEKIEQLIASVAELENAVFIRNSREHTVEEAVEHMRMKWEAAGERITTAREFIEGAASRSSMSGRAYEIRFADGRVVTSHEFLLERLREIERVD